MVFTALVRYEAHPRRRGAADNITLRVASTTLIRQCLYLVLRVILLKLSVSFPHSSVTLAVDTASARVPNFEIEPPYLVRRKHSFVLVAYFVKQRQWKNTGILEGRKKCFHHTRINIEDGDGIK